MSEETKVALLNLTLLFVGVTCIGISFGFRAAFGFGLLAIFCKTRLSS